MYLSWLVGQIIKNGGTVKRGIAKHVNDAASFHHSGKRADVVVNCTGLSSLTLGGVEDEKLYPARGQIVVVRNDPGVMTSVSGTDDGPDEATYIMHRAAGELDTPFPLPTPAESDTCNSGGGTILGGCLQKHNWDSQPDPNLAIRIMKRSVQLCPALTNGKGIEHLSVIRHAVGLRPMREGGPRVEKEKIDDVWVVHQFGHGGYGYQASYGSAEVAKSLVAECQVGEKARL